MIAKENNYRSRKLLDSFKDAPVCFGCGKTNDGTVVGAHANGSQFGKGMGIKSHDFYSCGLCSSCHALLDQGDMSRGDKHAFWLKAWIDTVAWWFQSGKVKPV